MWNIAIPAICVVAHIYLVVIFMPGFWRDIDARGFRWHNGFSLFVVPLMVIALLAIHVLNNFESLSTWSLVVAFLAVDALIVAMVLAAVALNQRRKRAA